MQETRVDPWPGRTPHASEHLAHAPQLRNLCSRARAPQQEKPPQWKARTPQLERHPCFPQLERAYTQQQSPSTAKNKSVNKIIFLKIVSIVTLESKSLTSCHLAPEYLFLQNKGIYFIITMSLSHLTKLTVIPLHHVTLNPYSHFPSCLENVLLQLLLGFFHLLSASKQAPHDASDSCIPHLSPSCFHSSYCAFCGVSLLWCFF